MKGKSCIAIVCYNTIEFWESREKAMAFYKEGGQCCDGCEAERYWHIVGMLMDGANICNDNDYNDAREEFFDLQMRNCFAVFENGTNIRDKGGKLSKMEDYQNGKRYKRLLVLGNSVTLY